MEFVNELLEEQQELLLENLKWSEGEERLQDINRLEEVVRALSILSEVGVTLPTKEESILELKNRVEDIKQHSSMAENKQMLLGYRIGFEECDEWIRQR